MSKKARKIVVTGILALFFVSSISFALKAVCDDRYGEGIVCMGDCDCIGIGAADGPENCQFRCWDEYFHETYCYELWECQQDMPI